MLKRKIAGSELVRVKAVAKLVAKDFQWVKLGVIHEWACKYCLCAFNSLDRPEHEQECLPRKLPR